LWWMDLCLCHQGFLRSPENPIRIWAVGPLVMRSGPPEISALAVSQPVE
jgi:hypothetical protein